MTPSLILRVLRLALVCLALLMTSAVTFADEPPEQGQ
jgi:hypothetical protein